MTLRSFLVKRFVYTLVLIFFVIILNWVIFEAMPGVTGALYDVVGGHNRLAAKQIAYQDQLYGLNQSALVQFEDYVRNLATFNFGISFHDNTQITQELLQSGRLVNTLVLVGLSTILAIIIGILLGIVVSRRRGSASDNFFVTASLTTYSLPTFFIGIMLIFVFADFFN